MVTAADRREDRLSISCSCFCIGHHLSPMEKRRHGINENRNVIKKRRPICTIPFISMRLDLSSLHSSEDMWQSMSLSARNTTSAALHLIFLTISLSLKGIRRSRNNQCCTSAFELFTRSTQELSHSPILAGLQWKL